MSDFDKEAERERLREKFEREDEKREVTERMSELLLQGATMTNAHCSECGDPIFRYDGQEFCATCEKPVDRDGPDDGSAAEEGTETDGASTEEGDGKPTPEAGEGSIEVTAPSDDARVQFGASHSREEAGAEGRADRERAASAEGGAGAGTPEREAGEEAQDPVAHHHRTVGDAAGARQDRDASEGPGAAREGPTATSDRTGGRGSTASGSPPTSGSPRPLGSPGVDRARGALRRTLTRFSQQAEATEDPREAEAYLSAAREAAETLAALRH
ncbi:MAG: Sjogren's syndrome/scleroderma autoantigen 1 family protein [Haloarculaceae archaeon]